MSRVILLDALLLTYVPVLTLPSAPKTTPPLKLHATMVVPVCGFAVDEPDAAGLRLLARCPKAFKSMLLAQTGNQKLQWAIVILMCGLLLRTGELLCGIKLLGLM